jgi:hypothetical protein
VQHEENTHVRGERTEPNEVRSGVIRKGKKPKKHDSIWCPQCNVTNTETLKHRGQ